MGVTNMEIKPNGDIQCSACGNDVFKLNESDQGSLNVVCTKCGSVSTFGAGMSVKDILRCMKMEID